jgi:hypothetical protein
MSETTEFPGHSPYVIVRRQLKNSCEVCGTNGSITPAENMGVNHRVPDAVAYCSAATVRPCGMTYGLDSEGRVYRTGFIPR